MRSVAFAESFEASTKKDEMEDDKHDMTRNTEQMCFTGKTSVIHSGNHSPHNELNQNDTVD